MKVKIQIDTMTFIRFWLVVMGFILAALAIFLARSALVLVVASFFLALALNAPVHFLARFMPGRSRLGGTAVAYTVIVGLLASFLVLVVPPLIQQSVHFVESIPRLLESNQNQINYFNHLVDQYHLESQVEQAVNSLKDNASQMAANQNEIAVVKLHGGGRSVALVVVRVQAQPTHPRRHSIAVRGSAQVQP